MNAQRVFQCHSGLLAQADDGLQCALARIQLGHGYGGDCACGVQARSASSAITDEMMPKVTWVSLVNF